VYVKLKYDLAVVLSVATAVCLYNEFGVEAFGTPNAYLPKQPFDLVGPALSLLLVFRTNASYGRFTEARALWGSTLNRSRDLSRQTISYVTDEELAQQIVRWVAAFPKTMMTHLRPGEDLKLELRDVLSAEEIDYIMKSPHRPCDALNAISALVSQADVDPLIRHRMDSNITQQHDNLGACERIYKTPIPLSYSRHTSRFVSLYLWLLPLALQPAIGWDTIPASFMAAVALLGIEEIGILIEEPFSVLPLEKICDSAHKNSFDSYEAFSDIKTLVTPPETAMEFAARTARTGVAAAAVAAPVAAAAAAAPVVQDTVPVSANNGSPAGTSNAAASAVKADVASGWWQKYVDEE